MPPTDAPIRSTDSNDVIEANIEAAREQNERERLEVTEAPECPDPIRATEVPRDGEHRGADTTPVGYSRYPEERARLEAEVALGPFVGPIDGEGTDEAEQAKVRRESLTGGRRDEDGNLLYDPGIGPGHRPTLGGVRDEDGNLIADHDGDGIAAAHEKPIREATGGGVDPEASEEDQHGSRSLDDDERDLDEAADETPEPTVTGEVPTRPQPPTEDATAEEWRQFARDHGVEVSPTANKAITKAALREAGLIQ